MPIDWQRVFSVSTYSQPTSPEPHLEFVIRNLPSVSNSQLCVSTLQIIISRLFTYFNTEASMFVVFCDPCFVRTTSARRLFALVTVRAVKQQ